MENNDTTRITGSMLAKIAVGLILIIIVAIGFAACEENDVSKEEYFEIVSKQQVNNRISIYVVYDKETKVMYSLVTSPSSAETMIMLYNPDGTIRTYTPNV